MEPWLQTIITICCSVIASSGFWAWMQARHDRRDAKSKMLLGLGHDRIVFLCMKYIDRGWITNDEYEDLSKYLYGPYLDLGGNGTAKRLMQAVGTLPIHKVDYLSHIKHGEQNVDLQQS